MCGGSLPARGASAKAAADLRDGRLHLLLRRTSYTTCVDTTGRHSDPVLCRNSSEVTMRRAREVGTERVKALQAGVAGVDGRPRVPSGIPPFHFPFAFWPHASPSCC